LECSYHRFTLTGKHGPKWGRSNGAPPTPQICTSLCRGDGSMCNIHEGGGEPLHPTPALLDLTRTMYVATYWSYLDHPSSGGGCPKNKEAGTSRLKPLEKEDLLDLVLNPKSGWVLCTLYLYTHSILLPSLVPLVRFANTYMLGIYIS
jgi:hypothetical protein